MVKPQGVDTIGDYTQRQFLHTLEVIDIRKKQQFTVNMGRFYDT